MHVSDSRGARRLHDFMDAAEAYKQKAFVQSVLLWNLDTRDLFFSCVLFSGNEIKSHHYQSELYCTVNRFEKNKNVENHKIIM